jgi:hypothetical protein
LSICDNTTDSLVLIVYTILNLTDRFRFFFKLLHKKVRYSQSTVHCLWIGRVVFVGPIWKSKFVFRNWYLTSSTVFNLTSISQVDCFLLVEFHRQWTVDWQSENGTTIWKKVKIISDIEVMFDLEVITFFQIVT